MRILAFLVVAFVSGFVLAQSERSQENRPSQESEQSPANEQPQESEQGSEQGQDAAFTIRIGVILPESGGEEARLDPAGEALEAPGLEGPALEGAALEAAALEAVRQGLEMAGEELGFNVQVLGFELEVTVEEAADRRGAARAASSLADGDVLALVGGFGDGYATSIATAAADAGVPFLNIGSTSLELRNEECSATMYHIVPGGGMYLDSLAGWFVGSGFRDWYLIADGSEESEALAQRFRWTLSERHFGARIVGASIVTGEMAGEELDEALQAAADADAALLLVSGTKQIELAARADELGLEVELTGFPWPETDTREFYAALLEAAPIAGASFRASAWEPTLDAYGARELNARFQQRFGEPMDAPAWAAYQALKLVVEAVGFGGVRDSESLTAYLAGETTVFDVWKGIGVTFRPWNNQLRQTLYLVELRPEATNLRDAALLVGELPEIYMPRTDPVERLDQLGDSRRRSGCSF